ncbi:hypothetical protein BDY19DRAFT_907113 [Irpex rosettiformis]|uniref:Uncharacterized protein n=1 Tax=Irpex rosettiformis TaxID=378272 RepID=A0ACB8U1W3_9APHY|nr:hypothetical protein BDY19DRAFT_907113 [Irpex rosettiformis]
MSNIGETPKHSEQPPDTALEGTISAVDSQITTATTNQDSSPTPTATATLSPTAHSNGIDGKNPFADTTVTATSLAHVPQEEEEHTPALPPRPEPTHNPPTETTRMATNVHFADEIPNPTNRATDNPQQMQTHPSVAQLKGIFPDFDDALLESVLASVNYNEEAAVEALLGMSDPSYVSSQPQQPAAAAEPTSLELDEALARQLQLEDDRQASHGRGWQPVRPASGQTWPRRSADSREGEVPYATREGHPQPQTQDQGQGSDFNEIRETFNQIAESGKRTFSSIFSKVKAKINEFDTGNRSQQQPGGYDQHPPPSWGVSSSTSPPPSDGPRMDRHSTSQYYSPSQPPTQPPVDDGWTRIGRGLTHQPVSQAVTTTQPTQTVAPGLRGYDVGDEESINIAAPVPVIPHTQPPTSEPIPISTSSSPPTNSSSTNGNSTPRPPTTQAGSPLNVAKFGLLPKRPVSLLGPQGSGTGQRRIDDDDDDDDDDLDYVESPFDSRKDTK